MDDERITVSQRSEMYMYLVHMFFPSLKPTPCCGPQQWEASGVKYIAYTTGEPDQLGTAVTSLPRISVDHTAGKVSAQIIVSVGDQITANKTVVIEYGSTSFMVYEVDWLTMGGGTCTIYEVYRVQCF